MIIIIARFDAPEASRERLLTIVRDMDACTAAEPGCIHYTHAVDVADPGRLVLSEVWESAEALQSHFRSEHFIAFQQAARDLGVRSTVSQFEGRETMRGEAGHWRSLLPTGA